MNNCECGNFNAYGHTNAFVDMNGVPYLLAEYLDRNAFQQIDRSAIKSQIIVDQNESMRAVVDISVDDIGRRASDGYLNIIGNNSKIKNLIRMISNNRDAMDSEFKVLRRGIVIRVDYQLENYRTHQVIRSMTENFRILDRNYFLDINSRDVNDNAIIVNFCNTIVSTINEFTHGQDPMMLRITNVHMSYEMVKATVTAPRVKQSMFSYPNQSRLPIECDMDDNDLYQYHNSMQNRHYLNGYSSCVNDNNSVVPPSWYNFNRFYHFDNSARDIIIHTEEINDPRTKVALIPCGTIRINRAFMINPGHRIIFKFSIWKNDITVVNDTTPIAKAIRAYVDDYGNLDNDYNCNRHPISSPIEHNCHCNNHEYHNHHNHHSVDNTYDDLRKDLIESKKMNYRQNEVINQISESVNKLTEYVKNLGTSTVPPTEEPDIDDEITDDIPDLPIRPSKPCCKPNKPPRPSKPPIKPCECEKVHDELESMIEEVDKEVDMIQESLDNMDVPNLKPISNDIIDQIVSENDELTDPLI